MTHTPPTPYEVLARWAVKMAERIEQQQVQPAVATAAAPTPEGGRG